jgi:hypothetical protein
MLALDEAVLDLQREPLALIDRGRVTADGLQWIVQKRQKDLGRGAWESVIYCQSKPCMLQSIGWEVYRVGEVDPQAVQALVDRI